MSDIILYKTFHKFLLVDDGDGIVLYPIYKSIKYSIWCYSHIKDIKVVGTLSVKHTEGVFNEPFKKYDSLDYILNIAYEHKVKIAKISQPTIPPLIPKELLYDKDGNDKFLIHFPEDIAIFMRCSLNCNTECIFKEFDKIIKSIHNGKHICTNNDEYTYFQTYIIQRALIGGLNGYIPPYNKQNSKIKILNMINKDKIHSLYKYIARSSHLSYLRDINTTTKIIKKSKVVTSIDKDEVILDPSVRDYYESMIQPYLSKLVFGGYIQM